MYYTLPWGPGSPGGPGNPSFPGGPGLPWACAANIAAGSFSWDRNTAILSTFMKEKITYYVMGILYVKIFQKLYMKLKNPVSNLSTSNLPAILTAECLW
jgi:hypothetical protein